MTARPLVCFDWDGVLSKGAGYHWPLTGLDLGPLRQAHERGYAVAVMTCNTVELVAAELRRHGVDAVADPAMERWSWHDPARVLVTGRKLSDAVAYVDDRAVRWEYGQDPAAIWDALEPAAGRARS